MNQFYNIWNYDYIQQQAQAEHHFSQVKQVQDTAKALSDFLDGCDKIEVWHKDRMREEKKLSFREWRIAIVSAVIGAIIGLLPWLKELINRGA